jgi:hypothetical protein
MRHTAREATSDEVKELKAEARQLKETLAEVLIENRRMKLTCPALPGLLGSRSSFTRTPKPATMLSRSS